MLPSTPAADPNPSPLRFTCSICEESSKDICVWCTKDCCPLHRCERCNRCSDCCQCDAKIAQRMNGHNG